MHVNFVVDVIHIPITTEITSVNCSAHIQYSLENYRNKLVAVSLSRFTARGLTSLGPIGGDITM